MANTINEMIRAGHGDSGRLEFIRRRIKGGKRPYETDRAYVESLLDGYTAKVADDAANPDDAPKPAKDEMARILLQEDLGDHGRLEYILRMLESGSTLRTSDEEYLHAIYEKYADAANTARSEENKQVQVQQAEPTVDTLQHQAEPTVDTLQHQAEPTVDTLQHQSESIKTELNAVQRGIDEATVEMASMSKYKSRLSERIKMHGSVLLSIKEELQDIKGLVKEQNASMKEQARVLDAIREERMQLEKDAQRMVGITAEIAEERKKLAAARKDNRALKAKSSRLAKVQKDLEKANKALQGQREKVAQMTQKEKKILGEQTILKKNLEQEIIELEGIKEKNARQSKLAERALQDSKRLRQTADDT